MTMTKLDAELLETVETIERSLKNPAFTGDCEACGKTNIPVRTYVDSMGGEFDACVGPCMLEDDE
jgi:hypothetical protein